MYIFETLKNLEKVYMVLFPLRSWSSFFELLSIDFSTNLVLITIKCKAYFYFRRTQKRKLQMKRDWSSCWPRTRKVKRRSWRNLRESKVRTPNFLLCWRPTGNIARTRKVRTRTLWTGGRCSKWTPKGHINFGMWVHWKRIHNFFDRVMKC